MIAAYRAGATLHGVPAADARFAVVVTHNRPAELAACVAAIAPQVDLVLVVDNASDPPASPPWELVDSVVVVRDDEQPPNLSRLWNLGLDAIRQFRPLEVEMWDVAVLNDDAIVPDGWFAAVAGAMREHGAAAACQHPDPAAPGVIVHRAVAPFSVSTRLAGWAFILRGELTGPREGLRCNERLRWWCGDDDLSAKARARGGLAHVPGFPVPNLRANSTTVGVLAEQAARDMQTFVEIWGQRPW